MKKNANPIGGLLCTFVCTCSHFESGLSNSFHQPDSVLLHILNQREHFDKRIKNEIVNEIDGTGGGHPPPGPSLTDVCE